MKTNVADTSIQAYGEITREGQIANERELIFSLIEANQPTTSRNLMYLSRKERGNITRSIFDLVSAGKIEVVKKDKCPTSGRTVRFYGLKQAC
ncbi:MAG: hypothetical protein ACO1NS_02030 [Daejeonella sp.]